MTNMILPDIVKSSKNYPLGPDCVITRDSQPDESVLVNMDLYWLISLEKGCVELKVVVNDSSSGPKAVTHDPMVIVTWKPRRFEAYCCTVCRQNFVTVVQALLHMKAFHRQGKKILIQDQNVFHDIEKAMEVPPVPLPWYVAKRVNEQGFQLGTSSPVTSDGNQSSTTVNATPQTPAEAEINPVKVLLQAIVKEYGKQVHTLHFGEEHSDVQVKFEDNTSIVAYLPDVANRDSDGNTEVNLSDALEFNVQQVKGESGKQDSCVVRASNPALAQKLLEKALKQGVAQGSGTDLVGQDGGVNKTDVEKGTPAMKQDSTADGRATDSPSQVKLDSRGRPSKTVRFMLGAPDSDEDGSSSASERMGGRESMSPTTSASEIVVAKLSDTAKPLSQPETLKQKEDEGLQGVVNQLISTASKGISPVEPVSPLPTAVSSTTPEIREEIIATASLHARFMPKNRSVPNLSSMTVPVPSPVSLAVPPSVSTGMVRVQSWGGGGPSDPLQRFSLSSYTPSTPQNFDHMSRDELRKSFLTVGRSFTYAEKIKLMNKLNDEDALITQEHVKGAGKLLVAEASRQERSRVVPSSSTSVIQQTFEKPHSTTTMVSSSSKPKQAEPKIDNNKAIAGTDVKKKRRSKYDVDKFITSDQPDDKHRHRQSKKRTYSASVEGVRSSSEGSLSDSDEVPGATEETDENPPSFLNVLRTNFGKTGFLAPTSGPSTSQHIPTSYPSMLSDSEYYGSGEWANTAMQTLRKLQTINKSPPKPEKQQVPEPRKSSTDDDSRTSSPFVNISSEMPSPAASSTSFIPASSSSNTDGSIVDPIVALAQQITAEKPHLLPLPKHEDVSKVRSQRKRSLSPLLTEGEKEIIRARAGPNSNERPYKKAKKDKGWQWHGVKSEVNSNNRKKANAKRRPSDSTSKSFAIAEKGDSLQFIETLTSSSVEENDEVLMKFCKGALSESDSGVDATSDTAMDMAQIFTNSIETLAKVRYVEKVGRCRVCGYSVAIDDGIGDSTLRSHVMEHSLKELLQAGCNGKQLN